MSDLETSLREIWSETAVDRDHATFEADVLTKIARRRVLRELRFAVVLAIAICALAWALGPALERLAAAAISVTSAEPFMVSIGLVVIGFAAWSLPRLAPRRLGLRLSR